MIKPTPNPPHTDPLSPHETLDPARLEQVAQRVLDNNVKIESGQLEPKAAKQQDYFIVALEADAEGMLED
ncbi:hypothetical protein HWD95_13330, partial [Pseudomonas corrugata]|nr:hypothetical protein [Pseudomonas corrugata]